MIEISTTSLALAAYVLGGLAGIIAGVSTGVILHTLHHRRVRRDRTRLIRQMMDLDSGDMYGLNDNDDYHGSGRQ